MKLKMLSCVLMASEASFASGQAAQKPNVVLIIADDHRADWMGHKGNPFMVTPNLDRLAAEGISFENAFATSGVCSPSRASILTGRYAHRASAPQIIWRNNSFLMTQKTFPQYLKQAGYRTGYIGKLHLGEDEKPKPGFDEWIGFPFVGNFNDQPLWINGKKTESKGFTDDRLAELAAEQIKKWNGAGDDPFCLIVGLKASHIPFQYPERMKTRLADTAFPKPATWGLRKPGLAGNCIFADQFQPGIPSYGTFEEWIRSYSRLALTIDESVGTIVQALEKSGQLDNTLLIYTSDQGYSLGEFGLCEKHYAYEQIMRVPMIVRYPKVVSPGMKRDQMVLNLDITPTVLDLCGVPAPEGMDGKSWASLFAGTNAAWRDEFFFDYWSANPGALPPMQAVRTDRYKLIDYLAKPVKELYDLKNDPQEQRDLYDHPEYAAVQREMEARLEKLKSGIGFQPREIKLLQTCFVLGPVAAVEEAALRNQLAGGTIPESARRLVQPFDLSALKLLPGNVFYIAVPIDRLTDYDPHVTFEFFAAGGFLQWSKKHIPMAAFYGDEVVWMNKPYADAVKLDYAPIGKFNDLCNYPLTGKKNMAVFRCIVPQQMPKLQAEIVAPDGAVQTRERE